MGTTVRQSRQRTRMNRILALGSVFFVLALGFLVTSHKPRTHPLFQCPNDGYLSSNVVVAVKTGAAEASKRVEVLMRTSLRCARHVLFFSDLEQDVGPYHLHDALESISSSVEDPIFEFYHRQRNRWRKNHDISDLKGITIPGIPDEIAAWSLDKYKNMHILEKTWEILPDKEWYVFIDADTYVVWSNLLKWLSSLDPMKMGFFGSKLFLGDTGFMHGGSGMVMSKRTVYNFAVTNNGTAARWDPLIHKECCGDFMMSKALTEYGNDLSNVWPSFSGQRPCTFPYSLSESYWCQPVVTMHQMSPSEMQQFDDYEMQRENTIVSQ